MTEPSHIPRIVVAALKGGAGKTFLTIGLVAALKTRGLSGTVIQAVPVEAEGCTAVGLRRAVEESSRDADVVLLDTRTKVRSGEGGQAAGETAS